MKKTGLILIIAGVLVILGAGGLAGYNVLDSMRAQQEAAVLLEPIAKDIEKQEPKNVVTRPKVTTGEAAPEMPAREYSDLRYIGIIEVPSLGLSLPVFEDWSYDLLRRAPCRYSGSYYTNDLVICAHNYRSHFSSLLRLNIGADVYFTAVNGEIYHYVVSNRETLQPEENERMIRNDGSWDMTLFTCFIGGQTRCTLRCTLVTSN